MVQFKWDPAKARMNLKKAQHCFSKGCYCLAGSVGYHYFLSWSF